MPNIIINISIYIAWEKVSTEYTSRIFVMCQQRKPSQIQDNNKSRQGNHAEINPCILRWVIKERKKETTGDQYIDAYQSPCRRSRLVTSCHATQRNIPGSVGVECLKIRHKSSLEFGSIRNETRRKVYKGRHVWVRRRERGEQIMAAGTKAGLSSFADLL